MDSSRALLQSIDEQQTSTSKFFNDIVVAREIDKCGNLKNFTQTVCESRLSKVFLEFHFEFSETELVEF